MTELSKQEEKRCSEVSTLKEIQATEQAKARLAIAIDQLPVQIMSKDEIEAWLEDDNF